MWQRSGQQEVDEVDFVLVKNNQVSRIKMLRVHGGSLKERLKVVMMKKTLLAYVKSEGQVVVVE